MGEFIGFKVIYYTAKGCRDKEFDNESDAIKFFERHVKNHPEYQNTTWSRTELLGFKEKGACVLSTLIRPEFKIPDGVTMVEFSR